MNHSKHLAAFPVLFLATAALTQTDAEWQALAKKARLSLAEAAAKALELAGSGALYKVELEQDGGAVVWSVDVAQGTQTCNLVLDAATGAVRERTLESDDHSAAVAASRTPLVQALGAALKQTPGTALVAELIVRDGRPWVEVVVLAAATGQSTKVAVAGSGAAQSQPDRAFTDTFALDRAELVATGENPFFLLRPGYQLLLEGKDGGEDVRLQISVLDETVEVDGVRTRIVEERETKGGRLVEVSRNFFALSRRTGSVYYFGEDVDVYRDGKVASHEGAWRAGVAGARFGLAMPGEPLLGARYYQEVAPGVAMDRAEVVSLAEQVEAPAGKFTRVLVTEETTPLESARELKYYAPGVGLVRDGALRLVRVVKPF